MTSQIGDQGEGEGVGQFRGLAVNTDDLLLVCDGNNNNGVQVVTPNGEFITSFGSVGSGKGQFHLLQDITATPDGRVFIADNNHRIQVFEPQY